eukprot:3789676-Rhodomonas_salina.2
MAPSSGVFSLSLPRVTVSETIWNERCREREEEREREWKRGSVEERKRGREEERKRKRGREGGRERESAHRQAVMTPAKAAGSAWYRHTRAQYRASSTIREL